MRSVLLLALLLLAPCAHAMPSATNPDLGLAPLDEPTVEDWARDLEASRGSDRLLAARELRRQARYAARRTGHRDPFVAQGGVVALADLATTAGPAARRSVVAHRNVRRPCADLLALIGDPIALGELRQALEAEDRRGVRRHLEAAIGTLEGAP